MNIFLPHSIYCFYNSTFFRLTFKFFIIYDRSNRSSSSSSSQHEDQDQEEEDDVLRARRSLVESTVVRATLEIPRPIPNVLALDVSGDLSSMPIQRLSMLGCELVRWKKKKFLFEKKRKRMCNHVYGSIVVIVVVIFLLVDSSFNVFYWVTAFKSTSKSVYTKNIQNSWNLVDCVTIIQVVIIVKIILLLLIWEFS